MPRKGENIRKRKDGRWEGRYIRCRDAQSRAMYTSVYGKTYAEVKQKLLERKKESLEGKSQSYAKEITYEKIQKMWLETISHSVREQTYMKYQRLVYKHILPWFGGYRVENVTTRELNRFIEYKKEQGKLNTGEGMAASSIQTLLYIVKATLKYAREEGYQTGLFETVRVPVAGEKEILVISKEEQTQLERYLCKEMDGSKLGILICLYTGLRLGEICGLRWEDINFSNNSLSVRRTIERISSKEEVQRTKLIIGDTKTHYSRREIPLPSFLMSILREQYNGNEKAYLITGTEKHMMEPRTYQYRFKSYLKKAKIRETNFHALRHTFASDDTFIAKNNAQVA